MAKKEVFVCDFCNKPSPHVSLEDGPPYDNGWKSLTNFEFKASEEFRHELILKHFCSNHCMISFLNSFV